MLSPVSARDECDRNNGQKGCNNNKVCKNPNSDESRCVECVRDGDCGNTSNFKCNNNNKCEARNQPGPNGQQHSGGDTETADDSVPDGAVNSGACYTARADRSKPPNGTETEVGCIPKDPAGFAIEYYGIGLGLIGGLSLMFLIFGGYILLTSQGMPERIQNGKTFIFYAIFGLILAIFGYVFIEVIAVDILRLPGFSR